MKKILTAISIIFISIYLVSFNEAQATTITCTGDRTTVCADGTTGSGGTWRVYGDKAVIQQEKLL